MVMMLQVIVFWVLMPCSIVVEYQLFGGLCCIHLQGEGNMEAAWS